MQSVSTFSRWILNLCPEILKRKRNTAQRRFFLLFVSLRKRRNSFIFSFTGFSFLFFARRRRRRRINSLSLSFGCETWTNEQPTIMPRIDAEERETAVGRARRGDMSALHFYFSFLSEIHLCTNSKLFLPTTPLKTHQEKVAPFTLKMLSVGYIFVGSAVLTRQEMHQFTDKRTLLIISLAFFSDDADAANLSHWKSRLISGR